MSKTTRKTTGRSPDRRISVRSVRREEPDLRKLARALIAFAMAKAEADAEREANAGTSDSHPANVEQSPEESEESRHAE